MFTADHLRLIKNWPHRSIFPEYRIIHGEDADIKDYPYQVSLQNNSEHNCGASIISKNYIITAGHCVFNYFKEYLTVRSGSSYHKNGGNLHTVAKVELYKGFRVNRQKVPSNDIAFIQVVEPFDYDESTKPIKLFNSLEESEAGKMANLTGWGDVTGSDEYPDVLQRVSIPIISRKLCEKAYSRLDFKTTLPQGQTCAAYYGVWGKNHCSGDSGGPLAIDGRLAGVISWSYGCAQPNYSGVYTEVAYYRD